MSGQDERGPVRDGWCCWTCADIALATVPPELLTPAERAALAANDPQESAR